MITAAELRARTFTKARSGFDAQQVQDCLLEAASTIEDLEVAAEHLQLRLSEAEAAVVVAARDRGRSTGVAPGADAVLAHVVRTIEGWGADPDRQAMQLAVGRAFVDAEIAAARVLTEAERHATELLGLVGGAVEKLTALVGQARSSVQAAANLPTALASYETELARVAQVISARRRTAEDGGADGLARLAARQATLVSQPRSEA